MTIFWFRRDLRLADNHGLYAALSKGEPVQAIFIFDKKNIDILFNDNYVIGMPWWDYWIPIISNKNSTKKKKLN